MNRDEQVFRAWFLAAAAEVLDWAGIATASVWLITGALSVLGWLTVGTSLTSGPAVLIYAAAAALATASACRFVATTYRHHPGDDL